MLFHSPVFLFAFLPATFTLFYLTRRYHSGLALSVLILASLVFYGWWEIGFVPILVGSVLVNYAIGRLIRPGASQAMLTLGVAFNLGLLGYYKYTGFFFSIVGGAGQGVFGFAQLALPLGISFFTFQQIAYLVDRYRGTTPAHGLRQYLLFVSFFPQLIAGPIVHQQEMLPQFEPGHRRGGLGENVSVGMTIFAIGLFKKLVLADTMAGYSTPVFNAAEAGAHVDLLAGWIGALAYTFQIYFDFSGYSDMAIGLGRLFGIKLPQNFDSPYKAVNIVDFWRRWHITLSRFLRDYLYIPLGGNRKGRPRRHVNLMITMLLGGLWHGAGWTFVVWGGIHGLYLCLNHAWGAVMSKLGLASLQHNPAYRAVAMLVTFLGVVGAWVFFRAPSVEGAMVMFSGMAGQSGLVVQGNPFYFGAGQLATFGLMALIVWCLPNTQSFMAHAVPVYTEAGREVRPPKLALLAWKPDFARASFVAVLLTVSMMHTTRVHEFIYFQF